MKDVFVNTHRFLKQISQFLLWIQIKIDYFTLKILFLLYIKLQVYLYATI